MKIIFMGTPDFAVESLRILVENNCNVVAVITAPDKPIGRGLKMGMSAVKEYVLANAPHIPILQPEKLKNPDFLAELKSYQADLQIVVANKFVFQQEFLFPQNFLSMQKVKIFFRLVVNNLKH